ncbi:MAG: glycosyltransferase family 2 protein [Deltaproteobacteria bacterium]|nr:glycosyltransferase family 2 protein [Deltaproteobacteria bacterium]
MRLSICMATFNRAAFIGRTLDSIVHQAPDDVEIVIVDGGSSDNTKEVVSGYGKRFPGIRYLRQEKNMGVDRDFNTAVEMSRGDYCWLMSDDDVLKPGAIRRVLEATERGHGLIVVNAEVRDAALGKVLDAKRLRIDADRLYRADENARFFEDVAGYLTFIGCVVIKSGIWKSRDREPYFGSLFIHVGVIFQQPVPGDILVIAAPLVSIRYGNALWTARGFEIWMFKWPDLVWSFPGLPETAKRRVVPREPWRDASTLLTYRAIGAYSGAEYDKWLKTRFSSNGERFPAWAIARFPGTLLNLLGLLYFSLFHPESRMPLTDMLNSRFCLLRIFRGRGR